MPTDDAGREIVVDFGRESASRPLVEESNWQPIGAVARRVLKEGIVSAGMSGAISRKRASRLIQRLDLRGV